MLPRVSSLLPVACAASIGLTPVTSGAQSMQDVINDLFVFSEGGEALFLGGASGVHGNHFIPAEAEGNAAILQFFNNTIATNVASFPLSSTVSSQTFVFVGGVPTPSSNSFGPIFAERAQTLGRGRLNAGVNYSRLRFAELRGVDLDDVRLRFVHENVTSNGFPCDIVFQGDCSLYGFPQFENDVIDLFLDLDMEADVFAFFVTFGVTDWLDLGVAIPVVDFEIAGSSLARINVTTGDTALHFFGGTPTDPDLEARSQSRGQTSGIGDVAARLKARIVSGENWQLGALTEVRAPTGREEDFLGSGEWNAKGLAIVSGTLGDFSPHANLGYEYRGGELDQDEVEIIAGFDHRLAPWATLAIDVLGSFKVGTQKLDLPDPVNIESPFPRTISLTNIPDRRDDTIDGSLGFKFRSGGGLVVVTNVLVPLNNGGLRSSPIPTLGLEYSL